MSVLHSFTQLVEESMPSFWRTWRRRISATSWVGHSSLSRNLNLTTLEANPHHTSTLLPVRSGTEFLSSIQPKPRVDTRPRRGGLKEPRGVEEAAREGDRAGGEADDATATGALRVVDAQCFTATATGTWVEDFLEREEGLETKG